MRLIRIIIACFFITIVLWLSFIPASVNYRYGNIIYFTLIFFLAISFFCHKKTGYFSDNEFDKFIWLFLIWNFFSALFAYNKDVAFKRYLDFAIPFITIYFMAKNELDSKSKKQLIYVLFFTGVVVSVIGILEFIYNKNIIYEKFVYNPFYIQYVNLPRTMSTMVHPTILGTYLMICLPGSYFIIENISNRIRRVIFLFGLFIILMAIILTFSRTAWLTAIAVTLFYFYNKDRKKIFLTVIFVILFLCASLAVVKFKPMLNYRVDYRNIVDYLIKGHRVERYPLTLKMLKNYPFAGVGLNNYGLVFDKYYGPNNVPLDLKIPDNMYLMIAGETGLIGIGLFIVLLFYIIKKGVILLRDKKNKNWDTVLVIFSILIGVFMHMLSYDLFYWNVPFFLFLLFLGGLAGYANIKQS